MILCTRKIKDSSREEERELGRYLLMFSENTPFNWRDDIVFSTHNVSDTDLIMLSDLIDIEHYHMRNVNVNIPVKNVDKINFDSIDREFPDDGDIHPSKYSKYNSYNGYSDEAIDEAFEGDPTNTWNVD